MQKISMGHGIKKISLIMVFCLIVTSAIFPRTASANRREISFSNPEAQGYIYVEGGEYSDNCSVSYSSTQEILVIWVNCSDIHLKTDGTAWYIYDEKLCFYNNYASGANQITEVSAIQIYDDSSGSAYCYKNPSGDFFYLPSFEDLKNKNYVTEKVKAEDIPTEPEQPTQPPVVTSEPTPEPEEPTSAPTNKPTNRPTATPGSGSSKPGPIDTIVVIYPTKKPKEPQTSQTSQSPQVSQGTEAPKAPVTKVAKSGSSVKVTQDGEVISKVTFSKKKATATFKVKGKNKKVKKVKQAFIIGKSYNYGYITKANKFKTINRKTGKVKTYSGKWKKATIKKNVAVNVVKLKGGKKKTITGF